MELVGSVKNYEWGKRGNDSVVAQLVQLNSDDFKIVESSPYAELWMGDHPSGRSKFKSNGGELKADLPFLFKVLSIQKALSIQVHPNKSEAERLHRERPDVYQDSNHKPELAIALTPFMALCGFRPYKEIYCFCQELPPLMELLGGEALVTKLKDGTASDLRQCYEKLMMSDAVSTAHCIDTIEKDYKRVLSKANLCTLFEKVNADYPQDVGVLSIFFLNVVTLQPGQAIFLGANEIHAYLCGDCIECMACSDNVIRAGLTPKYKDVKQLISCLNYEGLPASAKLFQPHRIDQHVQIFIPPVKDFAVMKVVFPQSLAEYRLQVQAYASILLVLQGESQLERKDSTKLALKRGSIIYLRPEDAPEIVFLLENKTSKDFVAYIAMYNYF